MVEPVTRTVTDRRRRLRGVPLDRVEVLTARRVRVAELLGQGRTYRAIASELGCSAMAVCRDRAALVRSYQEKQRQAAEELVLLEVASLEQLEREALDAWRATQAPRWLDVVLRLKSRKHALLGLDRLARRAKSPAAPEAALTDEQLDRQFRLALDVKTSIAEKPLNPGLTTPGGSQFSL